MKAFFIPVLYSVYTSMEMINLKFLETSKRKINTEKDEFAINRLYGLIF